MNQKIARTTSLLLHEVALIDRYPVAASKYMEGKILAVATSGWLRVVDVIDRLAGIVTG
jgi:hypothetical protein